MTAFGAYYYVAHIFYPMHEVTYSRKKRVPENIHELVGLWWSYGQYKLALVAPKGRGEPLYIYIYYWFMDDGGRSPQSFRKAL